MADPGNTPAQVYNQCTNLISKKVLYDFMNFCQFSSVYF